MTWRRCRLSNVVWSIILRCCILAPGPSPWPNPKSRLGPINYKIADSTSCYVSKIIYTNDAAYAILCCEGVRRAVLTIRTLMSGAGGDCRADLNEAPAFPVRGPFRPCSQGPRPSVLDAASPVDCIKRAEHLGSGASDPPADVAAS